MKFLKKFITIGMLAALAVGSVACSQDVKLDIDNLGTKIDMESVPYESVFSEWKDMTVERLVKSGTTNELHLSIYGYSMGGRGL